MTQNTMAPTILNIKTKKKKKRKKERKKKEKMFEKKKKMFENKKKIRENISHSYAMPSTVQYIQGYVFHRSQRKIKK
jgi:hypothetical protein